LERYLANTATNSINALYGAVANKYFQYFIERMAEAITLGGQLSIMTAEKALNDFMNRTLKTQNVDYVIYCVSGDTTLEINDSSETIEDLYNRISVSSTNGVKKIHDRNIFVLSYNTETEKREYKRATAVIKRSAKKKLYKIWVDETKSITVSEDHRFIVKRNGIICEATAPNLRENDVFINIHGYTTKGVYQCTKSVTEQEDSV
jgi:hypothetical protein